MPNPTYTAQDIATAFRASAQSYQRLFPKDVCDFDELINAIALSVADGGDLVKPVSDDDKIKIVLETLGLLDHLERLRLESHRRGEPNNISFGLCERLKNEGLTYLKNLYPLDVLDDDLTITVTASGVLISHAELGGEQTLTFVQYVRLCLQFLKQLRQQLPTLVMSVQQSQA